MITIYHNQNCGTSRTVLGLLRESGAEPQVIEYLKTPPSREEVKALAAQMGVAVRDMLRRQDALYREMELDDPALDDEALLDALEELPILLNRPIVVTPQGVRHARPPEVLWEIMPRPDRV